MVMRGNPVKIEHEREPCSKTRPARFAGCLIASALFALSPLDAVATAGGHPEPALVPPEALTIPTGIALAQAGEPPGVGGPIAETPETAQQRLLEMLVPNTPSQGAGFYVLTVGQSPRDLVRVALGEPRTFSQTDAAWDRGRALELLFLNRVLAAFDEDGRLRQLMLEPSAPLPLERVQEALVLGPVTASRPNPRGPGEHRHHRTSGALLAVDGERVSTIWLLADTRDAATAEDFPTTREGVRILSAQERLTRAARNGDLERVRDLLPLAGLTQAADRYGRTPLHYAAAQGHAAVVEALLDAPTPAGFVDTGDHQGLTPLHLAAFAGHGAVVEILLKAGADINATDRDGITPLHLAARDGRAAVAARLIERGADGSARDASGRSPVEWAKDDDTAHGMAAASEAYRQSPAYQAALATLERFLQAVQEADLDTLRETVAGLSDTALSDIQMEPGQFDYEIRRFHAIAGRAEAEGLLVLRDTPTPWDGFQFTLSLREQTDAGTWQVTDSEILPAGVLP